MCHLFPFYLVQVLITNTILFTGLSILLLVLLCFSLNNVITLPVSFGFEQSDNIQIINASIKEELINLLY
jgi:hypothetical protein